MIKLKLKEIAMPMESIFDRNMYQGSGIYLIHAEGRGMWIVSVSGDRDVPSAVRVTQEQIDKSK